MDIAPPDPSSYPPPPSDLLEAIAAGVCLAEQGPVTTAKITFRESTAVVKYGPNVRLGEALAMDFVQSVASDIPVPTVIGVWRDSVAPCWYVVTEWVDAENLQDVWSQMQQPAKDELIDQLRRILQRLRSLVPPEGIFYVGSVGRSACTDPLVRDMGPYKDIKAFTDGLLEISKPYFKWNYISIVERLLSRTHTYRIVFTHGDLHISNILVRPSADKPEYWEIAALIDWECAGWYPEHWEYVKLLNSVKWKSDWAIAVQGLLERTYDEDFLLDSRMRFHLRI
ncbi:kinase-like protein [Ramaria rubella]|nr:kinase-like protein [Ramaria rubella]